MLKKNKQVREGRILLFLIPVILIIILPFSRADSNFLFKDDFPNDKNWTSISGTWKAGNGIYTQSGTAFPSISFAGENNWDDYTYEAKAKFNSMGGIGLVFRANDEKQYYVAYLYFTREFKTISLIKHKGPGVSDRNTLAVSNTPLSLNKWYTIKVAVKGDSIKIFLDDNLKIDARDAAYSKGKAGLYSWGTDASFDDVKVYSGISPPQTATQYAVPASTPAKFSPIGSKDIANELPNSPYEYKVSMDYGLDNTNWNGASKIFDLTKEMGYYTETVDSFHRVYNLRNGILVILYPDFGIDPAELYNYVGKGGNVLIADDFGYGNYALGGFPVSFGYGEINNEKHNYGGNNFAPEVSDFKKQLTKIPVANVVTNHPGYLISKPGEQDLAYFPEGSYIDKNFNGIRDPDEAEGSFPFARMLNIGRGKIIILSDPSIFTNGMLELNDNQAFYESIITGLSGGNKGYRVYFENRLASISKWKISKAGKQLNQTSNNLLDAQDQFDKGDFKQCLGSIAKGKAGIAGAKDTLFGKEGKERTESEIEKALKEIENLKQEINDSKKSGKNTLQAEKALNESKEKIKNAISSYSREDYSNALKNTMEAEDAISRARDLLFGKNSKERAIIELSGAQKDYGKLEEELNRLKNDKIVKNDNRLSDFLNPFFTLQTWFLLFMALAALFLGDKYVPTVSSFFKRSGTTSKYLHSMEKARSFDIYNEPAIIIGREFKEIFYKNIGAAHEMPVNDVVKIARARYPGIKKRRLNKTLKTIEKLNPQGPDTIAARFNGKEMQNLYSDIYAILNEIKEVETFENRKYRQ